MKIQLDKISTKTFASILKSIQEAQKITLCKKINYGKNNNFSRYEPVPITPRNLKMFLTQLHNEKTQKTSEIEAYAPKTQCGDTKTIDFLV